MSRRFRLPPRPDIQRIQATRVSAARVQTASAAQATEAAVVALGVPEDLQGELSEIRGRLDALEP